MKLIITEDYIFDIIKLLKSEDKVVGLPDSSYNKIENLGDLSLEIVAKKQKDRSLLSQILSNENEILFEKIKNVDFSHILMSVHDLKDIEVSNALMSFRRKLLTKKNFLGLEQDSDKNLNIKLYSYSSVKNILRSIEEIGELVGKKNLSVEIAQRYKAQLLNLINTFYERLHNKKVIVLRQVGEKFEIYGSWVADIVNLVCAKNLVTSSKSYHQEVSWSDICALNPDTIIVAPQDYTLQESLRTFKYLEKLPRWDSLTAVKRTEVYFCSGFSFQSPLKAISEGVTYIISAIAGLPSGQITKRDSFQRLRWLELMRHTL